MLEHGAPEFSTRTATGFLVDKGRATQSNKSFFVWTVLTKTGVFERIGHGRYRVVPERLDELRIDGEP